MGTLLWSPTYANGAQFALQRAYMKGFVLVWQPGSYAVSIGRTSVFREVVFGGYSLVITFKAEWWNWSSNTYTPDWIMEDFYALPPGGGSPINQGAVLCGLGYDNNHPAYHNSFITGSAPDPLWIPYPPAPPDYWLPSLP